MLVAGGVNLALLLVAATNLRGRADTDTIEGRPRRGRRHPRPDGGAVLRHRPAGLRSGVDVAGSCLCRAMIAQGLLRTTYPLLARRLVTLVPALLVLASGVDPHRALVLSQVVLSFGIPSALVPLVRLTGDRRVMGDDTNSGLADRPGLGGGRADSPAQRRTGLAAHHLGEICVTHPSKAMTAPNRSRGHRKDSRGSTDDTRAVPHRVTHLHRSPVRHYAEHRSYGWYVDVDDLPRLPWWLRPFSRFDAADHFHGAPEQTLRQRVDAVPGPARRPASGRAGDRADHSACAGQGVQPVEPILVPRRGREVRCVVAEVQNLRGDRTAYLLPRRRGRPRRGVRGAAPCTLRRRRRFSGPVAAARRETRFDRFPAPGQPCGPGGDGAGPDGGPPSHRCCCCSSHPFAPQMVRLSLRVQHRAEAGTGTRRSSARSRRNPNAPCDVRSAARHPDGGKTHTWAPS